MSVVVLTSLTIPRHVLLWKGGHIVARPIFLAGLRHQEPDKLALVDFFYGRGPVLIPNLVRVLEAGECEGYKPHVSGVGVLRFDFVPVLSDPRDIGIKGNEVASVDGAQVLLDIEHIFLGSSLERCLQQVEDFL